MLGWIETMLRGEAPQPPIATLIGFAVTAVEPGRATIELDANGRHYNPMGTLAGGVLGVVADTAMGYAYASTLGEGESFTTLELKINFVRPFRNGKLVAVGRVIKGGRTVGLVECDVTDPEGRLIARASCTCMTLRGEMASGR